MPNPTFLTIFAVEKQNGSRRISELIADISAKIVIFAYHIANISLILTNINDMAQKFDLKKFRLELGLTQSELAAILHIPQSSISAMENGKTKVAQTYINILAEQFHVDNIESFFTELEDKVHVNNENCTGNNNGYFRDCTTSGIFDEVLLERFDKLEKEFDEYKARERERVDKLDRECDLLRLENKSLLTQLFNLKLACVENGIDFKKIISEN